jgi:hypothetical protein
MQAACAEAAVLEGSTRVVASPRRTESLNAEAFGCPVPQKPPQGQPCVVPILREDGYTVCCATCARS